MADLDMSLCSGDTHCWLVPAFIGQVVGLVLGVLIGEIRVYCKTQRLRRQLDVAKLKLHLRPDNSSSSRQLSLFGGGYTAKNATAQSANGWDSSSPALELVEADDLEVIRSMPVQASQSTHKSEDAYLSEMKADAFNEALTILWPHISKYVEKVLREDVQPLMQESMPEVLSGIRFTANKCHLGKTPARFDRVTAVKVERAPAGHDPLNSSVGRESLRLVADVSLVGDCEIELEVPWLGSGSLGTFISSVAAAETHLGVSDIRLSGTLVVELCHLLDDLPLIGGIQVYFVNPPSLDLKLTGALGLLQNVAAFKKKLMDAVLKQLTSVLVLPKRIASPLSDEVDIFRLSTPMPVGMMRIQVEAAHFLSSAKARSVPNFGTKDLLRSFESIKSWRPYASSSNTNPPLYIRVVFGDVAYCTPVAISSDGEAVFWKHGHTFDFTVHDPVAQKFMVYLHIEESNMLFGQMQGECLGFGEIRVEALLTSSAQKHKLKLAKQLEEDCPVFAESRRPEITIHKEWRSFSSTDVELAQSLTEVGLPSWTIHSREDVEGEAITEGHRDINCKLLIGFYGARNLPCNKSTYWCKVTSTNVVNFNKLEQDKASQQHRTGKAKETAHVQGRSCSHWRYGPEAEGNESDVVEGNMVEVLWEQPKFFHFHDLMDAQITVELFFSSEPGVTNSLGSFEFDAASLAQRPGLVEVVDRELLPPPDEALRGQRPSVRIVFQLWLLGIIGDEQPDNERDNSLIMDARPTYVAHASNTRWELRPDPGAEADHGTKAVQI